MLLGPGSDPRPLGGCMEDKMMKMVDDHLFCEDIRYFSRSICVFVETVRVIVLNLEASVFISLG